jgi:phosphate transport system permease protein
MSIPADTTSDYLQRAMRGRLLRDSVFKHVMTLGGISVIVAISAIFFYLASVVLPVLMPADMDELQSFALPGPVQERTVHLSAEEQREIGARFTDRGSVTFFEFGSGRVIDQPEVLLPANAEITSFGFGEPAQFVTAYGLSDGRLLVLRQRYVVTFPDDRRLITPQIEYPAGETPLVLDPAGAALKMVALQHAGDNTVTAGLTADGRLVFTSVSSRSNFLTGEVELEQVSAELDPVQGEISHLFIGTRLRDLYIVHDGRYVTHYDIGNKANPRFLQRKQVVHDDERISDATILSGGFSLIVGTDKGNLAQWFTVRDEDNFPHLTHIRDFRRMPGAVRMLEPEYYRKGFLAGDDSGNIGIYYATSRRLMLRERISDSPIRIATFTPRADGIVVEDGNGRLHSAYVDNLYPEVSWHSLWQKVWYESYREPEYIWQSSAATSDFEAKLSLAPLTFGTLKAAFYAMMVSIPLAILGAIFTAYFMSPRLRTLVKPSIEIMEALPTVILGFLAGLWLAPLVDRNLAGTLLTIALLPVGLLLAAYIWHRLPKDLTVRIPPGWEAALLIPVVIFVVWFAFAIGHPIEAAFFGGDMPHYLSSELGISYEQRNSLVVGIAMGFAVTPTIFSIAEDAIFSVPKHLTTGSLALGATPWQTLVGVVLLTASPGIFSAVMIGLGRAVGETMIVLMATGNTAVMDLSIFTGFRTLSANIGVEMPEAAVGTTHYRLLFMSALVLFLFTFSVNTVAELVRQRLREKYSSI